MPFGCALRAGLRRGGIPALPLLLLALTAPMQPTIQVVAPEKVAAGDTVEIALRLRNDESQPLRLELSGRPVAFDIVIEDADGGVVWRRLEREAVSQVLMLLTLQPGESRQFRVRWGSVDSRGRRVAPGSYTIVGLLPVGNGVLRTPPRALVIE